MKYYRKQPVEAIQWNGDNYEEVTDFILKFAREATVKVYEFGKLNVCYTDNEKRKHQAVIPFLGWVVTEGKTLQFYKDETFRKTFESATYTAFDKAFYDSYFKGFHGVPKEKIQEYVESNKTSILEALGKVRKNIEKAFNDKIREEKYKSAWGDSEWHIHYNETTPEQMKSRAMYKKFLDNYKKMLDAWIDGGIEADANELQKYAVNEKDVEADTFDSVLDEMKELHAKKNKDYKESFHDLFKEYGMPYALGHLEEKLNRVKAITTNGSSAVRNEHVEDSVIDLACYAVMLYVELKKKEDEKD